MKARGLLIALTLAILVCGAILVYGQADNTIPEIPTVDTSGPTYKVTNIVDIIGNNSLIWSKPR